MMHAHRRQFVIGPRPVEPAPDWVGLPLEDGRHLSHCPSLPVERRADDVVLGIAVTTEPAAPATADWAGRWARLGPDGLETDAAGTLACFLRRVGDEIWVSSSPALLAALEPAVAPPAVRPEHAQGMDWFPPPASGLEGITQLLPTQRLLADGTVARRALPAPPAAADPAALLDAVAARLRSAVAALARRDAPLLVPLSAGRDSRLLLAAVHAAGAPAVAYTFTRPGMDPADRKLPPRLAAAVGVPHRAIEGRGEPDRARLQLFDEHCAGRCVDVDRRYFGTGQLEQLVTGAIELGGGVFEVARCYYHAKLPEPPGPDPQATADAVLAALPSVLPDGVLSWAQWLHATPDEPLDWRDRFYIEQRSAGWLAAIAQARDLAPSSKLHPASCGALVADLLALPVDLRRTGRHHDALIRRLAPELAPFPFNPPASLRAQLRRRMRRELALLRMHGGPRGYVSARAGRYAGSRAARRIR